MLMLLQRKRDKMNIQWISKEQFESQIILEKNKIKRKRNWWNNKKLKKELVSNCSMMKKG